MSINLPKKFFVAVFFLFFSAFFPKDIYAAPKLYFDPNSINVTSDQVIEATIKIDTENTRVFGAEIVLNYPGDKLEVSSVLNGDFFGNTSYANNPSGRLEIGSYFSNFFEYKSGAGTVATILLKNKGITQTENINFVCVNNDDTFMLDSQGNNILSCNSLNQLSLSYTSSSSSSSTNGDEPNSCGGTCGSNYNCQANYFCYDGFCRNASCPLSTDCSCSENTPVTYVQTPKPNSKANTTNPSPTPQAISLLEGSPTPSPVAIEDLLPENNQKGISFYFKKYKKLIFASLGVIGLLIIIRILIRLIKKRKSPPEDQPPTITGGFNQQTPPNQDSINNF